MKLTERMLVLLLVGIAVWLAIRETQPGEWLRAGFSNVCASRPEFCSTVYRTK